MDAKVVRVTLGRDADATVGLCLMTGLQVCERGHLLRWPRFAELSQPESEPLYTHTKFLEVGSDGLVILDTQLYNSHAGAHTGEVGTCNLPHRVDIPYPVWRTWGPYNPHVLAVANTARLTVANLPFNSPLREEVGFVRQGVTCRIVGFTPHFSDDQLERLAEIPTDKCPYCAGMKYVRELEVRLQASPEEPDVLQGHLAGWRVDDLKVWREGMSSPRLFNHKFESFGQLSAAMILEDPRQLLVWADATGFTVTSQDHEPVTCDGGVWLFQHPLPQVRID